MITEKFNTDFKFVNLDEDVEIGTRAVLPTRQRTDNFTKFYEKHKTFS